MDLFEPIAILGAAEDAVAAPFDISSAPDALLADDSPSQDLILRVSSSVLSSEQRNTADFFAQRSFSRRIEDLQATYNNSMSKVAIASLSTRSSIALDHPSSTAVTDSSNPKLSWSLQDYYVDFLVCIGRKMGLDACIPHADLMYNFDATLKLDNQRRQFSAKYAKLGFDPVGSMQYIGCSSWSEDIWIAWVPIDAMQQSAQDFPAGRASGSTCLSTKNFRVGFVFLAQMLKQACIEDIILSMEYPDVENDFEFKACTNLHDRPSITISLNRIKRLNTEVKNSYHMWLRRAPENYRSDWFQSRVPVAVTSRYGQNQPIGAETTREGEESYNWDTMRDWSKVKFVSVAVATHLCVREVKRWEAIDDMEHFKANYPDGIYDSPEPMVRNLIPWGTIDEHPLEDEDGYEIPWFSKDGMVIKRRTGVFARGTKPHGILFNLANVGNLFTGDDDLWGDTPVKYFVYPQAGLRTAGHFQAHGLMSPFTTLLDSLNQSLTDGGDDSMSEESQGSYRVNRKPIAGTSSQGYNAVIHSTRGRNARHHDVQMGLVTSMLGGAWAKSNASKRTAAKLAEGCMVALPHQYYAEKITGRPISRDLRLENVYSVDMDALDAHKRTGRQVKLFTLEFMAIFTKFCCRTISQEILLPLAAMWEHSRLLPLLKEHVVLLKPEVFPDIYAWSTYPLTCLLERIYTQVEGGGILSNPGLVELTAVVERAINYMHTGNAAVISTSVMTPLWIGLSVVYDGLPCFNTAVLNVRRHNLAILNLRQWPFDTGKHAPKTASKTGLIYTYGKDVFNAFYAHLTIHIAKERPLLAGRKDDDEDVAFARHIMFYAISALIQDTKDLVSQKVTVDIKQVAKTGSPKAKSWAKTRYNALKLWLQSDTPLTWRDGDDAFANFARLCIVTNDDQDAAQPQLKTYPTSITHYDLAQRLINMPLQPRIAAPIVKDGHFIHTLPIALEMIKSRCAHWPQVDILLEKLLAATLQKLEVDFVPWHVYSPNRRANYYAVQYNHWMMLKRSSAKPTASQIATVLSPMESAHSLAAQAASQSSDSPWEIPRSLHQMDTFWTKDILPMEWAICHASLKTLKHKEGADIIIKMYEYVQDNFGGQENWIHSMAMIWGILFSKVAPNICHSKEVDFTDVGNPCLVTQDIRNMPWIQTESTRKGLTEGPPLLTMMVTAIIAYLDDQSPLAKYLVQKKYIQGSTWTNKHGTKQIHAINFIRMGLAKAFTHGVMSRALYKKNWDFLTKAELKALYDRVKNLLNQKPHGLYNAIVVIFGDDMAIKMVERGEIFGPHI